MNKEKWITERTRIISEMLDNPGEYEIYPTSKCFEELDTLFDTLDARIRELEEQATLAMVDFNTLTIEHQELEDENKRLHKVLRWWRAATWRFVMHHSKTLDEAEEKIQRFERDCGSDKEEVGAFTEALKEK